ncbi:uncharacterized protein GGS22DRAFT_188652 [Annulohypoxylon maeteangense]|uniref:uncharacterized protein n=1 Tax=Annulohypoxylon maeteangense TaxID=1927788 RepID=UPI002008511A|nr:uncharacterized protein GGS22DRAFT_188652 [Annulohypoxylon maeteangense]KAI0885363.1 hypothetical protein GGS22DRAFT_188652 [Annulohypoxylon maeteangense]
MAPSKARSRFEADLKLATEKDYTNITNVRKGDAEDGFTFVFSHPSLPHPSQVEVHAQPQDMGGYPSDNSFLVYTNDDISPTVAQVLEASMFETMGMKVDNVIADISRRLRVVLETDKPDDIGDVTMADADAGTDIDASDFDMEDAYGDSDEDLSFELDEDGYGNSFVLGQEGDGPEPSTSIPLPPEVLDRLRRDLRSVLSAGFHSGIVYGLTNGTPSGIISISVRVNKLCLPKVTREAWSLVPSEYIVLLIRYDGHYADFENVLSKPVGYNNMSFRLRKCSEKKPSYQQARIAFASQEASGPSGEESDSPDLPNLWISKSMDEFMNNELISLLKIRKLHNMSWEQAKERLQSQIIRIDDDVKDTHMDDEGGPSSEPQLSPLLADDHLLGAGERSLPLIAMQFALRYLVRCTDYCTVCHQKVKSNFAALMPYVCSAPLCLHQYINLGFGPSIDHQIINHPEVIDLLISFTFASLCKSAKASGGIIGMRHLPTGLGLRVPRIRSPALKSHSAAQGTDSVNGNPVTFDSAYLMDPIDVSFDWGESTATILRDDVNDIVGVGQWVVVATKAENRTHAFRPKSVLHHARVELVSKETLLLNVVSRHTMPNYTHQVQPYVEDTDLANNPRIDSGYLVLCNDELDDLDEVLEKAFSLIILLASMPSVADMRSYLMSSQQPLTKWDRMSRASVDLLRWVIASNRSHIVKVGEDTRHPERIGGVKDWIQFRFTQGSPEKENLFYEALEQVRAPQKTILAWHGSSFGNWHSIIREGLDYATMENGRTYGDGIYFARDFDTSLGYALSAERMAWPRSHLRVNCVISLNELVNLPYDFKSNDPYYVVQHCHWTQCRYIFVQPMEMVTDLTPVDPNATQSVGTDEFQQDPGWTATGLRGARLSIPKYAIPSAHKAGKGPYENEMEEIALDSSDEDEDDTMFIYHEGDNAQTSLVCDSDFRPGTLDFSSLPQLAPPSYADYAAQRALGQEIKKLEKIQSSMPLHLLGWYIDFERLNNLFQWIVEFHSFDRDLPLAKDMEKAGLTSIVLEIRFLRGFPISPPFVRIIRPRFLPFMDGGGGHVTSGGALCMELLTNSGWSPANSLESVLLQVRMAICSEDPRPARLESTRNTQDQYGVAEAVEAYKRAAATHGWEVPADLADVSLSGQ